MREVLEELPLPTRVACDVSSPLLDAVYVFARQKGAREEDFEVLAERLRGLPDVPARVRPAGWAAPSLRSARSSSPARSSCSTRSASIRGGYDLVVTGEGVVDETTWAGKAPGEVVRRCRDAGVRCELFSARDDFSGDPARASEDLFEFGRRLAGPDMSGV